MSYLGDYAEDATLDFAFNTHEADGTPITLAGTPDVSVYKANSDTPSTTGVTLTVDFDSVTGLHHVRIDTSADAFYAVANDYKVVITTGTVDGVSVVGTVIATFSIENRFAEVDVTKIAGSAAAATLAAIGWNGLIADTGTAQAGSSTTLTLRAASPMTDDLYNGAAVAITGGTGSGQVRKITDGDGTSKVITVSPAFVVDPDNTSTYIITGRIE